MPYTPHPDYKRLPEVIQAQITPEQYAWLSDEERARLIEDCTMPEVEE